MPGALWYGYCSEQLRVPGVPMPADAWNRPVSFGVVQGTSIGYIYVWSWAVPKVRAAFESAVHQLTEVQNVDGLVIDFRSNLGGFLTGSLRGIGALLPHPYPTVGIDERKGTPDHFKMKTLATPSELLLDFHNATGKKVEASYDGPVAVLVGPGAVSSGDFSSYWMRFHPRARTFGKSTSMSFNVPTQPALGTGHSIDLHPNWFARIAEANFYPVGAPNDYLTHREFPVDEEVWLRPADVAAGRDTVVEAALTWLAQQPR